MVEWVLGNSLGSETVQQTEAHSPVLVLFKNLLTSRIKVVFSILSFYSLVNLSDVIFT